jgi:outer membrane immunogenic protein
MKKFLASASFLVLGAASAMAADLPMKAVPYMAPPVFSWTGCYIGAHGGGGFMRDTFSDHGTGGLAGGQIGCNYQDGNWVIGLEGEGSWSGIKGTFTSSEGISQVEALVIGSSNTEIFTTKNKWDASIAARAGITFDRTLIYGKAGWVWGKFDYSASEPACCGPFAPIETINGSATLNGLLVGIGIEHALTQNWTVKLEYDYLRFGSKPVGFNDCVSGEGCIFTTRSQNADKQLFKVGFNYLFPVFGH